MGKPSRDKGQRGEREFAAFLRDQGYDARRGVQFSGGPDSPDIVCEALPIHWEVKRVERLQWQSAYDQATAEKGEGETPIVAHKRNHGEWMVTLKAADFFRLLREQ